jgi:50S ribosomal protein L16 3-hydroxylase
MMTTINLLGNLSPQAFLQEYWQKKPLLIRNAIPHFNNFLTKKNIIDLSANENAQARLVSFEKNKWSLAYSPFKKREIAKTNTCATLLIQNINHFFPEARHLLKLFNFIPYARLDDLMVSYAPDGVGVGPHFDSYDVFLLQGDGKRKWEISKQRNRQLVEDVPLRILKNFKAQQEWILEPGDMLYLPPKYAHNGIAIGESITYSIGFRAPSHHELANEFLIHLQDHLKIEGLYADPDLPITKNPACISSFMLNKITAILNKIHFNKKDIELFLGKFLTEPKPHIFFSPPSRPFNPEKFILKAKTQGLRLALQSQLLFTHKMLFMNGEIYPFTPIANDPILTLANEYELPPLKNISEKNAELLYDWYLAGYIEISSWKK